MLVSSAIVRGVEALMSDDTRRGPRIEPVDDGPLRYRRGEVPEHQGTLRAANGEDVPIRDSALLCRCGASERKPFCDGSHVSVGFSSARKWRPGAGQLVDYTGSRVTVHDNRALCAHVRYCVRDLPSVFSFEKRPWIDADGATAEEIIAACRRCPSGALSCTVDGVLYRNYGERPPVVIASADGPYFLEGGVEVVGEASFEGESSEHCTLCRCGQSRNKPRCDGKHKDAGFIDRKD
jgi:CDGSH-type Zn-finger protein